jgi:hypothetical protein
MSLDDKRSDFEKKLDELRGKHDATLKTDLAAMREPFGHTVKSSLPADIARRMTAFDQRAADSLPALPFKGRALVNLQGSGVLKELDQRFADLFNLGQFFSTSRLDYPTVYCETLPEFFTPFVADMDLSPLARQATLEMMVKQTEQEAAQGKALLGVNFPGRGCYLNGWMFVYGSSITPRDAWQKRDLMLSILATTAHEKLGHGFLSAYSAMGEVSNRLGLTALELSNRFGLRPADEPTFRLRSEQAQLLLQASLLLEEGYATWVEAFMAREMGTPARRYSLAAVAQAVLALPETTTNRDNGQALLLGSLQLLFGEERSSLAELHQAVMTLEKVSPAIDDFIFHYLGQTLRYVVGSLLMDQTEMNLGAGCVPYVALIAGNVTFDPAQISLADLRELLSRDPRLNPDTRLAALSQLRLDQPGDVKSMAQIAESGLSLSVPKELK